MSRVSPVQTAIRNCTRDEGRSFEAGNQALISSHRKLLSSKAMVVSVAVNVGRMSRRVRLREASASEPPMSARGRVSRVSPVQTAVRNCTRDEGRPFEIGSQVLVSNHCKLLSSKAMVVSVAANVGTNPSG